MCTSIRVAIGVVVLGCVLAVSSEAAADYMVSLWRNDTNVTVAGTYHWGSGQVRSFKIVPGGQYMTWWNLNENPVAPRLFITFDADPGPGIDLVSYWLRVYHSPTTVLDEGPTEVFVTKPNGKVDINNTRM